MVASAPNQAWESSQLCRSGEWDDEDKKTYQKGDADRQRAELAATEDKLEKRRREAEKRKTAIEEKAAKEVAAFRAKL
ncbi:MAG: hypothetical protein M1826_004853 [Phylliscum demangeonii]|nr:MAG: hypothetical protein M1826_004853 [Phylliscum demangeonii]